MDLKEFFLITLPGLENLAAQELRQWKPSLHAEVLHGGLTVFLPLNEGLSLNTCLKIPSRILLRVGRFKCRDFPKLFHKISKWPWEEWVRDDVQFEIHASSSQSRLNMKKRIEKACLDGRAHYQKMKKISPSEESIRLYVRFQNDLCTLSLDTSGTLLHKRSNGKHIGDAPMRETIGAALVQWLESHTPLSAQVEAIDPMMGSGTLLSEVLSKTMIVPNKSFYVFSKAKVVPPEEITPGFRLKGVVGIERDEKTFEAAKNNFKDFKKNIPIDLIKADIFKMPPLARDHQDSRSRRWILCNPPYGKRIKINGDLKSYYEKLMKRTDETLSPDLICLLFPKKSIKGKFILPDQWRVLDKMSFSNGGIPISAFLFKNR